MGRPSRPVNPVIGDRIKQARRSVIIDGKRMTQKALARELYVSCQAVKNWEQHINEPSKGMLEEISKICKVNLYWLNGFIDDVVNSSREILESCSPEYMEEHNKIALILWKQGYDLAVFENQNSEFFNYIKRHINGLEDNEQIEKVVNECMMDYELLKAGFRK